jgi:hypothetical protein
MPKREEADFFHTSVLLDGQPGFKLIQFYTAILPTDADTDRSTPLRKPASPHEIDDQFRAIGRVSLEEKMRAVENMRFHPRQILQPA